MIKKLILCLWLIIIFLNNYLFSQVPTVELPWNTWPDIIIQDTTIEWDSFYWKDMFKKINSILWISVWIIAAIIAILWWYDLIVSEWNQEELKKTNKKIIYWMVWIIIAMASYTIMKLIIDLF